MKVIPIFLVIAILSVIPVYTIAQSEEELSSDRLVIIDVGASISVPIGPFNRNIGHEIYGMGAGVYFQLDQDQPYAIGLDLFYNYVDSYAVNFLENIDGQDIELKEKTSSHLTSFMASLRYYPDLSLGKITPYAQVALGTKVLFTQTYLTDTDGGEIVNEFDLNEIGFSLSYGASFGANIQLSSHIFLNGKISYLPGNSVTYYSKLPSDKIQSSNYSLDGFKKLNSTTPIINYNIGVSFFL